MQSPARRRCSTTSRCRRPSRASGSCGPACPRSSSARSPHRIVLRNANGESDPLEFVVVAKPAQPPVLNGLQPADTPVDTPFSEQPDGTSLLTLDVEHAVPGAVVLFDGVTLPTTVQTDTVVTEIGRAH